MKMETTYHKILPYTENISDPSKKNETKRSKTKVAWGFALASFTTFTVVKELLNFKFPMINTLKLIKIKRYYFVNHTDILQSFIFDFCVIFTLPFLCYRFFFLFFSIKESRFWSYHSVHAKSALAPFYTVFFSALITTWQ